MPYLYTKNHTVTTGITDLISMLTIIQRTFFKIRSKKKNDKVILFIEEFSDYFELKNY